MLKTLPFLFNPYLEYIYNNNLISILCEHGFVLNVHVHQEKPPLTWILFLFCTLFALSKTKTTYAI